MVDFNLALKASNKADEIIDGVKDFPSYKALSEEHKEDFKRELQGKLYWLAKSGDNLDELILDFSDGTVDIQSPIKPIALNHIEAKVNLK